MLKCIIKIGPFGKNEIGKVNSVEYKIGIGGTIICYICFPFYETEIDRLDPSRVLAGSMFSGFLEINNFEITEFYDDSNTSLGGRPGYPREDGELYIGVAGFDRDQKNNLWVTNPYADRPLSVETEDGTWKSFSLLGAEGLGTNKLLTEVIVDDLNQKWAIVNRGGVIVFNEGESIIDESDDKLRLMTAEAGKGGLPSNEVLCITKDLDGELWMGSTDGVGVFYAPFDALTDNFSDARRILIQQNGVYQYLLEGQSVSSIAIDGANRKWVGTFGAGVFLLSEDGTEEVLRFTAENSPLISNTVNDIAIDRELTANQLAAKFNKIFGSEITNANVMAFGPPAIQGLGASAGFSMMIQDRGGNTPQYLAEQTQAFIEAAQKRPEIARVYTTYNASSPQIKLEVDNEKAMKLGVPVSKATEALGAFLGASYINDFNRFGRQYKVYMQAQPEDRVNTDALQLIYVKNKKGDMVPVSTIDLGCIRCFICGSFFQ